MKRVDKNPTQKELIDLIVENPIGRNADLASMAETILTTEGGMTYFLDGDWGSGKTFFTKQLKIVLEALNPNTENDGETLRVLDAPEIASVQSHMASEIGRHASDGGEHDFADSLPCLPIYYNAWENDHWDDPLPSIIQTIAWQAGGSGKVDAEDPIEKFGGIVGSILKATGFGLVSETCKTISGENLLQQYEDRQRIRHYIQQLIEKALDGRDEKMLLIIDELDRCRPVFALKLLEQVKSLLKSEKLVVLYSVNSEELAKTVEGQYGTGFDGARYLLRFYDMEFTLFPPEGNTYLAYSGIPDDSYRAHTIAHEMCRALHMSLRDQNRYTSEMARADSLKSEKNTRNLTEATFVENALATLLLALKVTKPNDYRRITSLRGNEALFSHACMSEGFLVYLDIIVSNRSHAIGKLYPEFVDVFDDSGFMLPETDDETRDALRKLVLNGTLTLMFDADTNSDVHRRAYRLIYEGSFGDRRLDVTAKRLLM